MEKDVFGYTRLKKVLDVWGKYNDLYFDALTRSPEANFTREKMDGPMKQMCGNTSDFIPFEQWYEWLPEITYGPKK